jgi:AmmeMemoRadiSam system protein B
MPVAEIRPSPIAGTWYSSDPQRLSRQVDAYLNQASLPPLEGEVVAVIAPHAGHRYSGRTAGYAFAAVRGLAPELVAVLSPYHDYAREPVLTTAHRAYATPLGVIPVVQDLLKTLDERLRLLGKSGLAALANDYEHSLEIELPFLQRALAGEFRLLPLMIRTHEAALLKAVGEILADLLKPFRFLLVASTDLSHFYPLHIAERLDKHMLQQFADFSPVGVLNAELEGTGFACGAPAVAAVLWAAKALGADRVQVLHHSTSADETGDESSVVGYGAAVVLKTA